MSSNEKLKILAIINPISGTSKKENVPELVNATLDKDKFDITIRFTERAGHATEMATEAIAENYYGVLAIGGDGTINEVASALRDSDVALGIIPCGSGNGMARHMKIPLNMEAALNVINENFVEKIDYCMVNEHPFFCTCGVGFDAHVSKKFAESGKRGPITYVKKTLVEYLRYRSEVYELEYDGKMVSEKAFVIACGNASQYGNNAYITPNASVHDGLIDVTVLHPFTPIDTAFIGLLLFTKHLDLDINMTWFRAKEVTIRRKEGGVMHLDGEPMVMGPELKVKCIPLGLKIFVSANPSKDSILAPIGKTFWDFVNTIRNELNI